MLGQGVTHQEIDEVPPIKKEAHTGPHTWINIEFYIDDHHVGWFQLADDGRVEIDLIEGQKKRLAAKLFPKAMEFPSMVQSISAEVDLRSPLDL